jgi:hypothetical protein
MKKVKTINKMKIKKYVILIIVGICILYAIFNSVIVDLIMKNSNTGCTKARIFTKSTGKTSYPLLNYNFSYKSEEYTGVISGKTGLKIEDSLCVVFLEAYPNINRPIFFFKEGEIKCNCK